MTNLHSCALQDLANMVLLLMNHQPNHLLIVVTHVCKCGQSAALLSSAFDQLDVWVQCAKLMLCILLMPHLDAASVKSFANGVQLIRCKKVGTVV